MLRKMKEASLKFKQISCQSCITLWLPYYDKMCQRRSIKARLVNLRRCSKEKKIRQGYSLEFSCKKCLLEMNGREITCTHLDGVSRMREDKFKGGEIISEILMRNWKLEHILILMVYFDYLTHRTLSVIWLHAVLLVFIFFHYIVHSKQKAQKTVVFISHANKQCLGIF